MSTDGIQVAANGTLSVAVADGAVFNSEVVQGALTLPETDLQRILLPGVQGILRSMLAKADAVQLLGERDVFVSAISTGLGEHLGTLGIGLRSFEVAEFTLPPEFREAMASGAIATARGRGEMVQARTEAEKRVLAAQADAAAMLLTGDARTKVFQQLQSAGIDPMSLEAIDVLKRYAENPSAGILGGDAVKAGLIGSITAAAIDANAAVHAASRAANFDSLRQIGNGPLVTPLYQNNAQVENAAANDAPAGPDTRAGLEKQLDALTERLANGELSEALYTKLASRIEAKIATLGESAS
jgi:regulator of protease activity HflC (stomatin/prohibitin superfamily)